jgi:hypothetical protein
MDKIAQQPASDQFERSFADLAYSYIRDQAPKLLDFVQGFQIIDKNEEGTRAVGIFGFKLGKQYLYAPVFFLNGRLKGKELLYIKAKDAFVPLQENWVNYMLSRRPNILGEAEKDTQNEMRLRNPDFKPYHMSPLRGWSKTSAAEYDADKAEERYGYWLRGQQFDVLPALSPAITSPSSSMYKEAADRLSLPTALKKMGSAAYAKLASSIRQYPSLRAALSKFYSGLDLVPERGTEKAAAIRPPSNRELSAYGLDRDTFRFYLSKMADKGYTGKQSVDKVMLAILNRCNVKSAAEAKTQISILVSEPVETKVEVSAKPSPAVVLDRDSVIENPPDDMTDSERVEVMEDGLLIRDFRPPASASKVYDVNMADEYFTPSETGLFEMVGTDGEIREVLTARSLMTVGSGSTGVCLIVTTDTPAKWTSGPASSFIVRRPGKDRWNEFFKALPDVSVIKAGETYVLIDEAKSVSVVFEVKAVTEDAILVNTKWMPVSCKSPLIGQTDPWRGECYTYPERQVPSEHGYSTGVRPIVISGRVTRMSTVGDALVVPATAKVLRLVDRGTELGFVPADLSMVQLQLIKGAGLTEVEIANIGLGFAVKEAGTTIAQYLTKAQVFDHLINGYGVTKSAARMMIDRVNDKASDSFLVKVAQGYGGNLMPGPSAPSVMENIDQGRSMDPTLNVMTEEPNRVWESVNLPLASRGDYAPEDPTPSPFERSDVDAIETAVRTGQKEVFDTTVIGSLVKSMGVDDMITEYVPDLTVGIDRLGRLLFLFYWHNEKFVDRYGDSEMRELEDTLKNSFNTMGDLVLFLKKKEIEPDIALRGSDVDLNS